MSQISDTFVPREDDWVGVIESSSDEPSLADQDNLKTIADKTLKYTIPRIKLSSADHPMSKDEFSLPTQN